jgi:2,3-bisphosphoglycerate-independent phosphoglycerate mutase
MMSLFSQKHNHWYFILLHICCTIQHHSTNISTEVFGPGVKPAILFYMKQTTPKPLVLIILDGWGYRADSTHNAAALANTPFIDGLFDSCPHRLIDASGTAVGLPAGQIGNSEVGHLHLGAGRLLKQSLTLINDTVAEGHLGQHPQITAAVKQAKQQQGAIHILGLLSPGGVHAHEDHIANLITCLAKEHQQVSYCHAFLDGRDVPPQSAEASLEKISSLYDALDSGVIASICGRFYAMDRDKRWDRTEAAFNMLIEGKAPYHADDAITALQAAYARDETDEFVKPTLIQHPGQKPVTIKENDVVIFMNFRADRAIQLSNALTQESWEHFSRSAFSPRALYTLTPYQKDIPANVIFDNPPLTDTFGETVAAAGLKQLRISETEKFAHVTYFFNGGHEAPYPLEERTLIPSPKVATYDLAPSMSAEELTKALCDAIEHGNFDTIICNYPNADMVGHTGDMQAAIQAMETLDHCLKQVVEALQKTGGAALITADHGNVELMFNEETQQPHTAHTNFQVPLIYVGAGSLSFNQDPAALTDVAPTLLALLNLKQPPAMTGRSLLHE